MASFPTCSLCAYCVSNLKTFNEYPQQIFLWTKENIVIQVLLDFSLTVKAATLIFISGCGSAIPSAKEGKSGFIYSLVKS